MQRRYLKISAILTGLALVAGACAGGTAPSGGTAGGGAAKTVKIYSSLPLTGPSRAQTLTVVNGIKMAVDEAGGKIGRASCRDGGDAVEGEATEEKQGER